MAASAQPGQYSLTLNAQKTGAYRLTARYKVSGNTNWIWYSSNGRRDHAIVVAPKKAREIVLYELKHAKRRITGHKPGRPQHFRGSMGWTRFAILQLGVGPLQSEFTCKTLASIGSGSSRSIPRC